MPGRAAAAVGDAGVGQVAITGETEAFFKAPPPKSVCSRACMGCLPCLPGKKPDSALSFSNSPAAAVCDHSISASRRVHFGIFFPEDVNCKPVHMFFDREKEASKILAGACAHAGLKMDKGRLAGSPERLNLFTSEGDVLRLDLDIEVAKRRPKKRLRAQAGSGPGPERSADAALARRRPTWEARSSRRPSWFSRRAAAARQQLATSPPAAVRPP